jgi:hypothetical protein
MPTNDDSNARGGDRSDRGVGPDPSVHDDLVRSVFDNYIGLLQQQNAMRLGGDMPENPMDRMEHGQPGHQCDASCEPKDNDV